MKKLESFNISEITKARYSYFKTEDDKYFWAVELWWDLESWEDKQEYLIAIIDAAPIDNLDYLGQIGAGPVEDLRDIHILEFISNLRGEGIGRDTDFDKKLCIALQMYRYQAEGGPLSEEKGQFIDYIQCHYPTFILDGMYHTE
jgi:hypothetical protein